MSLIEIIEVYGDFFYSYKELPKGSSIPQFFERCSCGNFLSDIYVHFINLLRVKGLLDENYEMKCCRCHENKEK